MMDEIYDPTIGEIVPADNVDVMADALVRVRKQKAEIQGTEAALVLALAKLAPQPDDQCRTTRLRGTMHRLKLEFPADYYEQKTLKELWSEFPDLSRAYLKIGTIDPMMREVKKLHHETGGVDFQAFRQKLMAARKPSNALPRVTLETEPDTERMIPDGVELPF